MKDSPLFGKPVHKYVGLTLTIMGTSIIVLATLMAYHSFYNFKLPQVQTSNLEATIVSMINLLVEIAIRLGFLGIKLWAGSILLKHGIPALRT